MNKNPKNQRREAVAKALFRPDNLVYLAVTLMLFTLIRVLWYL